MRRLEANFEEFGFDKYLSRKRIVQLLNCTLKQLGRSLFRPGNEKLSSEILVFGIPAVSSCPGRTELCGGKKALCYATRNHYRQRNVIVPRLENFVLANRPDFADLVQESLARHKQTEVRIHDSGDFFSEEYTEAWLRAIKKATGHRFFLLTRSWRVEGVSEVLSRMSRVANARVWYSIDRETGWPGYIPVNVRLAYMQVDEGDVPARPVDLVFRDLGARGQPAKRVGGTLVCPYENGLTRPPGSAAYNCHMCKLCWDELGGPRDPRSHHSMEVKGTGRVPLQLVATM